MRFEIIERDGLARTGILEIGDLRHTTPAIAFVNSRKYPAPEGVLSTSTIEEAPAGTIGVARSEFEGGSEGRADAANIRPGHRRSPYCRDEEPSDLSLPDSASSLALDSGKFVQFVSSAKQGDGILKPLYCTVLGLPHRLALLSYCGFDIFDSIPLIMAAENGSYLTSSGVLEYDSVKDLPCSCPACASGARGKEQLLRHNYNEAQNELKLIRHSIAQGRLRELVENRIRADPWLVQDLRLMDLENYGLQELHAPIKGAPFHAGSKESLSRPDIVRWRRRLEKRYVKPLGTRILLLIPCSARKPYSMSQSHMRFRQAVLASGKADIVHEVIVTSPLGLVPRELELFYPAQDYDIPVTGHWDSDEKHMAEDMVSWLVESQGYDMVISHLGDEREPVNSILKDFVDTSEGRPGSAESLERLTRTLAESALEPKSGTKTYRSVEDMTSLCRFQFGEAGNALCEGAKVAGRWPYIKILGDGEQLGMLTGERGMVSLTAPGAQRIADAGTYSVEIEDFVPKGNLFAVGVEHASPEIRIGDDVAVVHSGDVRAVGVARMCPAEMEFSERGEAVHIRHVA